MNINPINISNVFNVNLKKNNNIYNKYQQNDCFIKTNNVSFSSLQNKNKRQDTVNDFIGTLMPKVGSSKFSISDISNTVKKYAKNVNVKPMDKAPKEAVFSEYLQGICTAAVAYNSTDDVFYIPKNSRILYIKTETFDKELGNQWIFINTVHEFTHALQYADNNYLDLYNDYIRDNKNDNSEKKEQAIFAISTKALVEEAIARPLINVLNQYETLAYQKVVNQRTDFFEFVCRRGKIDNFESYVKDKLNSTIKVAEDEKGIVADRNLLISATINHLQNEIEAYSNENKAHKLCLGIESPKALTRVQLYEKTIEVLNKIKQELN